MEILVPLRAVRAVQIARRRMKSPDQDRAVLLYLLLEAGLAGRVTR